MSIRGRCGCGEVRYELSSPALFTHACHCLDCQNTTGSAFLINMFVDQRDIQTTGQLMSKALPTASGAGRDVFGCRKCSTLLWTRYHMAPANIVPLRAGTLDDTSTVEPAAHIFTRTKQSWLILPTDVPAFEAMYDRSKTWSAASLARLEGIVAGA